ncbi:polysaccharide lyase family 8 super-sandwich domain-containing protein [Paenibacillus koleovorans]|uniref:polysaccharide lyase family 8 super-sandwich domain-containing protein n=1 Tax=Paenibacillus koleovorans TaxID=121608 RepID=UPI000FD82CAF|nr:polysaccharide lyase family 8 super-sandwich domain-containing protein [Paenibacillus koleovorans]
MKASSGKRARSVIAGVLACILMVITFAFGPYSPNAYAVQDDFDVLRDKWKMRLTGGTGYNPSDPDIAAAITAQDSLAQQYLTSFHTPTSSQPYLWSDQTGGTIVATETSYGRLLAMAKAYATTSSGLSTTTKANIRSSVLTGMQFLINNWYKTSVSQGNQWFKFEIGVPKQVLDLTVLMYDDLLQANQLALVQANMNVILHFSPDPADSERSTSHPRLGYMTGANLMDKCLNHALVGILLKDGDIIDVANERIVDIFDYVTTGDGFYEDGSFIQHVALPYTGTYGMVMMRSLPSYISLLKGSDWELTDPDADHLYDWIYDSFEPVFFRGATMDMVRGRAISRITSQDLHSGRAYLLGLAEISTFSPPMDAAYFKGVVKRWVGTAMFNNFYSGLTLYQIALVKGIVAATGVSPVEMPIYNKPFPSMDRVVHHRPDFSFGISMYSNRIYNYEYSGPPQEENRAGFYTAEGMTYLYNGDLHQFSDVFWPTVDPKRLPGITVDYGQARAVGSGEMTKSPNSWVGGTEVGGVYGVAGMKLKGWNNTLTANKSWFMFDDEIVALGSGINSTDSRTIETVVDNRMINTSGNNALTVNSTLKSSSIGWAETMSGVNWAHLAGSASGSDIGYFFPGGATIKGLREARTGAWSDIDPYWASGDPAIHIDHTRNYVSLRFDHGTNPTNGNYAYVLLPNKTTTQVGQYAADPDIQVIENTISAQAVKETNLNIVAANFWENKSYTVDKLTSNKKASVMTRIVGNTLEVSVSDPTQENMGTIELDIEHNALSVLSADPRITVTRLSPSIRLSVNVNGAKGAAIKATFALGVQGGAVFLDPIADAFVKSGTDAAVNYGSNAQLQVKGTTNANLKRKTYLKFDLTGLATADTALVRLYGKLDSGTSATISVFNGGSGGWSEAGITWNNAPSHSVVPLDSQLIYSINRVYEFNVIDAVQDALGQGQTSLTLVLDGLTSDDKLEIFSSREAGSNGPKLFVSGSMTSPRLEELEPTDDANVRGTPFENDNYGTSTLIRLYYATSDSVKRKAYLKFDLSDYASIDNATLQLYGVSTAPALVRVYEVTNDTWSESTLTWSNAPAAIGLSKASFTASAAARYYQINLTELARSHLADGKLSLHLATPDALLVDFNSKENASAHPVLIVTGTKQ